MRIKIFRSLPLIFLLSAGFISIRGQDIHFSEFHLSPLSLNPAMTGFFDGEVRFSGIYRTQWQPIRHAEGYKTLSAAADFSLFKQRLKDDYFGAGLMFYRDKAGSLNFSTTNVSLSLAYSKGFGNRTKHSIAIGLQPGFIQKSIDITSDAIFPDDQFEAGLLSDSETLIDMNAGFIYHIIPRRRLNMYVGAAYHHLTRPTQDFAAGETDELSSKIVASAGALIEIGNNFNLLPSLLFLQQGVSRQINAGSYVQIIFGDEYFSESSISFGMFTRFARTSADALILASRVDYKWLTFGLSYDFTISELSTASQHANALEVSVVYIGKVNRQRASKAHYCPQF